MATTEITIKKPQNSLLKPIGAFFRRFHLLIVFVFVVGCVSAAIVLINKTLTESTDASYTSSINAGTIDQATLERIQSLNPSSQPGPAPALPEGRINPFAE
jgi:E3 ubiquitin-protein ligase DOA10